MNTGPQAAAGYVEKVVARLKPLLSQEIELKSAEFLPFATDVDAVTYFGDHLASLGKIHGVLR